MAVALTNQPAKTEYLAQSGSTNPCLVVSYGYTEVALEVTTLLTADLMTHIQQLEVQ